MSQLVEFAYKSALELIELYETSFLEIVDLIAVKRVISGDDIMAILEKNMESESFETQN